MISNLFRTIRRSFSWMADAKRMKPTLRIGTHSGKFHCDEALACFMLQTHVPKFKGGVIVRSRDPEVHKTCDILVDVGAEYVPEKNRFDHHQKPFCDTFDNDTFNKTKLSSAGLIYKHFGKEVIADILAEDKLPQETLDMIYMKVYETFVEAVDGVDNGVNQYEGEPAYQSSTDLGSRVGALNPSWNDEDQSEEEVMRRFHQAMQLTGKELTEKVVYLARSWWPARSIVQEAVDSRFDVHKSGQIIRLNTRCPWKKHFFEIEEEQNLGQNILYCVFPSGDSVRVQAIPKDRPDNFENRKPLPYKGLRDDDLSKASGVPDCIFVHSSGFIGGTKSMDSAMKLAILAQEA